MQISAVDNIAYMSIHIVPFLPKFSVIKNYGQLYDSTVQRMTTNNVYYINDLCNK